MHGYNVFFFTDDYPDDSSIDLGRKRSILKCILQ